jgi:alpha-tubulin suppressor-like RCC1 family protein
VVDPMPGRIAAGYQFACVVTDAGGVKCWGDNESGQLGNGTTSETPVPGVVNVAGLASGVTAIAAGGFHACALTIAGGVRCWGDNLYGQLGDGSTEDRSAPVDVVGLSDDVAAISLGWSHTCALTSAGSVKCWGNNPFGGLGDGTKNDSPLPVDVIGLGGGVQQVAAGGGHTCALTSVGGVKCWGDGQSDDPALFHASVPADVPGLLSGVAAITAGQDRTCALMAAGGVTCWGPNYGPPPGEIAPDRFVNLDVSGFPGGIAAIVAGVEDTNLCALTSGAGAACGLPSRGLTLVPGLAGGVEAIAVGGTHACALIASGAVTCWGSNTHGQLGTVLRCSSSSIPVGVQLDGTVGPVPTPEPLQLPAGRLEHATGAIDVLFRFDRSPDIAYGDLPGELFQPGPEFTLYGDGTVIFRDATSSGPPPPSRIVRVQPFRVAQLDEDAVQAFLRFALDEGGLWDACERYENPQDSDVSSWVTFTFRAAGIDKRVENAGFGPLGALHDRIEAFGGSHPTAAVWVADRYWGNLLDTSVFQSIGDGVTPGLAESGSVAWPWPAIAPGDFVGLADLSSGRRVMTAEEASVLGLSDNGGVVQRVYLRGPGGKTIFYFSLWPMSPDEPR